MDVRLFIKPETQRAINDAFLNVLIANRCREAKAELNTMANLAKLKLATDELNRTALKIQDKKQSGEASGAMVVNAMKIMNAYGVNKP